jgi:hypothetical protein
MEMRLVAEALVLMAAIAVVIGLCMWRDGERVAGGKTYRLPMTAEKTDGYGI